jgi:hypothetical protein
MIPHIELDQALARGLERHQEELDELLGGRQFDVSQSPSGDPGVVTRALAQRTEMRVRRQARGPTGPSVLCAGSRRVWFLTPLHVLGEQTNG